jgi:hypothetical protein
MGGLNLWFKVADIELLYMIKMSHRFLKNTPHFKKTMDDIWFLRNEFGCSDVKSYLISDYKVRQKFTYDYALPTLNKKKVDFFENNQHVQ